MITKSVRGFFTVHNMATIENKDNGKLGNNPYLR